MTYKAYLQQARKYREKMEKQTTQTTIGGLVLTLCDDLILKAEFTEELKKSKLENSRKILEKVEELKSRGNAVVKPELVDAWSEMIDISFCEGAEFLHYNGATIVACLECMERLSKGETIEYSYEPIDVQNTVNPPVHCNMELSGCQNNTATTIVATYHKRGSEFCIYRNKYVKIK